MLDDKPPLLPNMQVYPSSTVYRQEEDDKIELPEKMKKDRSRNNLMVMYDSETSLFDSKEDFDYRQKKKEKKAIE